MKSTHDFYTAVIGKAFDLDGYFGAQCWDGAMYYSQWLGKPIYHCGITGYVKDIWHQRKSSGILNHYQEVQKPFADGDIIVWDECAQTPLSHIAIFRKDNGNGTFIALGQNQGGAGGAFNQRDFTYQGVLGGFRPIDATAKPAENKPKPKPVYKPIAKEKSNSVYRLYNPNSGDHLYTTNVTEAKAQQDAGMEYEGIAWIYPETGEGIYRLVHAGKHHLALKEEHDKLVKLGWKSEGMIARSGGEGRPIRRLYNPNGGEHIFTTSDAEHDALVKAGWKCEITRMTY